MFRVPVQPDDEESREEQEGEEGGVAFIAHVPVPSQKEVRLCTSTRTLGRVLTFKSCEQLSVFVFQVEEALVRRKKMELLQRYASETLQAQSQEARTLLGL